MHLFHAPKTIFLCVSFSCVLLLCYVVLVVAFDFFMSFAFFGAFDFLGAFDFFAWQPCPTEDHQDDTQQPYPPQYRFSLYIAWLVMRYSEVHIPETREIRLLASHRPSSRPPSRLQLRRKVATSSSEWSMDKHRRLERSL